MIAMTMTIKYGSSTSTTPPSEIVQHLLQLLSRKAVASEAVSIVFENKNKSELSRYIKNFIVDKLSIDHVIIGDRVYIEYFKYKYRQEIKSISPSDREIYKYKLKQGMIR